jgi:hypothetical protein
MIIHKIYALTQNGQRGDLQDEGGLTFEDAFGLVQNYAACQGVHIIATTRNQLTVTSRLDGPLQSGWMEFVAVPNEPHDAEQLRWRSAMLIGALSDSLACTHELPSDEPL